MLQNLSGVGGTQAMVVAETKAHVRIYFAIQYYFVGVFKCPGVAVG
jgi:hypothetical protein